MVHLRRFEDQATLLLHMPICSNISSYGGPIDGDEWEQRSALLQPF